MRESKPSWLPDILCLSPWTESTYDILYKLYCLDFVFIKPIFRGQEIIVPTSTEDGKEKAFWHLTTRKDKSQNQRLPDLRRAERLVWIKPMLEQVGKREEIINFDCQEKKGIKSYVWLEKYDFVVILKKIKNGRFVLLTAYYVDKHSKNVFWRKYANRLK